MINVTTSIRRSAEYVPVDAPPATGYESPSAARDSGWLGQVPPPSSPPTRCCPHEPEPVAYANPQLAPEPWKADPPLPGTDPTLFG